jgi:hypothetical protein
MNELLNHNATTCSPLCRKEHERRQKAHYRDRTRQGIIALAALRKLGFEI